MNAIALLRLAIGSSKRGNMVQQVSNLVVERLLVIVKEQLVLDMMIHGKLVGDIITDEPLVLYISYVVEEVNRIVEQLVKAVSDTVMDYCSMEESCIC
nr:hypothetical protein [Tanacetum cinerariifolium]